LRGDVVGAEVDSVGFDRKGDIGAGVDKESSFLSSVLSSQLGHDSDGISGQRFQIAGEEILFAELNVIDSGADGLGDFFQEAKATRGFVSRESSSVGDVVEAPAFSHQLSIISSAVNHEESGLEVECIYYEGHDGSRR
jgi:hypothetical protein